MSRTSSVVKDRYNEKTYENVSFRVPKGWRIQVRHAANAVGQKSLARYIRDAVEKRMEEENHPIKIEK